VFTCPADITGTDNRGNLSYVVNGGFSSHWLIDVNSSTVIAPFSSTEPDRRYREDLFRMGLMFLGTRAMPSDANRRHSPDSVRDGISQTIAITENMNSGYVDPSYAVRQFPTNWGCPHPDITSFRVDPAVVAPGGTPPQTNPGFDYNVANDSSRTTSINGDVTGVNDNLHPYANSFHTTGVNVLMCDGSVRFIAQNVGGEIWAKLVTPDGGRLVRPGDGVVGGAAMENIDPSNSPNWGFTQLPLTEAIFD
jgi:prepilin-type processing-associated H-X9-DG protein